MYGYFGGQACRLMILGLLPARQLEFGIRQVVQGSPGQ